MRLAFRLMLTCALVAWATTAPAQERLAAENVFTFLSEPTKRTELTTNEITKDFKALPDIRLRPNTATEIYLWVKNPVDSAEEYIVEVKGRGIPTASVKVNIPANKWVPVRLPKPAPPPPAQPAVPAPPTAPAQPPATAPEPPPPGDELSTALGTPELSFRLLNKDGDPVLDDTEKLPYGRNIEVVMLSPNQYVNVEAPVVKSAGNLDRVTIKITQRMKAGGMEPEIALPPGTVPVRLLFPPQPALADATVREGIYRRSLPVGNDATKSVSLLGTVEDPEGDVRLYVGADGVDRAFAYILNPQGRTDGQLQQVTKPAVRVYFADDPLEIATATQPVRQFPIRVEVDNATLGDKLELHVQPLGTSSDFGEIIPLTGTRENQVWFSPTGPLDGGLLFTSRSRDWVKDLNLADLRGKIEIKGVLVTPNGSVESTPVIVTVDATPPEKIAILEVPKRLKLGEPLPVSARVNDPDTNVVKATFYLFRRLNEGKIPDDAIKAAGDPSLTDAGEWTASFKVPDDFRGRALVGVVFTNEVGLQNEVPTVQRIEIVDAGKDGDGAAEEPTGAIEGRVLYGGLGQPLLPVTVADADGKVKDQVTADEYGRFKFTKLKPGVYTVGASKPDSSTGASGSSIVKVEPKKVAKTTVNLVKFPLK